MKSLIQLFEGIGLIGIGFGLVVGSYIPEITLPIGIVLGIFGALQLK